MVNDKLFMSGDDEFKSMSIDKKRSLTIRDTVIGNAGRYYYVFGFWNSRKPLLIDKYSNL